MTTLTKMSITRALAEVKRLDDRIAREINTGRFVDVTIGRNQNQKVANSNQTVAEVKTAIEGSFDRIKQLMQNREAIKAAIVMSNATTKVTVNGKQYTVAEAIELKKSVVLKEMFLSSLRRHQMTTQASVDQHRAKLADTIERSLQAVYSSANGTKITEEQYTAIAKPQEERSEPAMLDPRDIAKQIRELDEEVSVIKSELDFVLSESNARVDIEVTI